MEKNMNGLAELNVQDERWRELPLKGGKKAVMSDETYISYKLIYDLVDIKREMCKVRRWMEIHEKFIPERELKAFLYRWFENAQAAAEKDKEKEARQAEIEVNNNRAADRVIEYLDVENSCFIAGKGKEGIAQAGKAMALKANAAPENGDSGKARAGNEANKKAVCANEITDKAGGEEKSRVKTAVKIEETEKAVCNEETGKKGAEAGIEEMIRADESAENEKNSKTMNSAGAENEDKAGGVIADEEKAEEKAGNEETEKANNLAGCEETGKRGAGCEFDAPASYENVNNGGYGGEDNAEKGQKAEKGTVKMEQDKGGQAGQKGGDCSINADKGGANNAGMNKDLMITGGRVEGIDGVEPLGIEEMEKLNGGRITAGARVRMPEKTKYAGNRSKAAMERENRILGYISNELEICSSIYNRRFKAKELEIMVKCWRQALDEDYFEKDLFEVFVCAMKMHRRTCDKFPLPVDIIDRKYSAMKELGMSIENRNVLIPFKTQAKPCTNGAEWADAIRRSLRGDPEAKAKLAEMEANVKKMHCLNYTN